MAHQLIVMPVHIFTTFVLNDYVMHDHTNHHDVPIDLLLPELRRTSHNSKLGLQNLKCSLHILPSSHSESHVLYYMRG
jgi:hypothetical protein